MESTASGDLNPVLCICESAACVESLIALDTNAEFEVVSLSAEASFHLSQAGREFRQLRNLACLTRAPLAPSQRQVTYDLVMDKFVEAVDQLSTSTEIPGDLFDPWSYLFKIGIDNALLVASAVMDLSLSKRSKVFLPIAGSIWTDDVGLVSPSCNLTGLLLSRHLDLKWSHVEYWSGERAKAPKRISTSFGQIVHPQRTLSSLRRGFLAISSLPLLSRFLDHGSAALTRFRASRRRHLPLVLGFNSRESRALRDTGREGKCALVTTRTFFQPNVDRVFGEQVVEALASDSHLREALNFSGIDAWIPLEPSLRFVAERVPAVVKRAKLIEKRLGQVQPRLIVVDSMSPFNVDLPSIRGAARALGIEIACWMHGGYGANEAAAGYDEVDLRLADIHIVYGRVTQERNSAQFGRGEASHNFGHKLVVVGGSPYLESRLLKTTTSRPKTSMPTVTFLLGPRYARNQFYHGYSRNGVEDGLFEETCQIFEFLKRHQDTFRIVVKDYPRSDLAEVWKETLCDSKIAFISSERSLEEVLHDSDLVIVNWISTTFFQTLLAKKPVILWDNGDLRPSVKEELLQHGILATEISEFQLLLESWLSDGRYKDMRIEEIRKLFISKVSECDRSPLDDILESVAIESPFEEI